MPISTQPVERRQSKGGRMSHKTKATPKDRQCGNTKPVFKNRLTGYFGGDTGYLLYVF